MGSKNLKAKVEESRARDKLSWRQLKPGATSAGRNSIPTTTTPSDRLAAIQQTQRRRRPRDTKHQGENTMTDDLLIPLSVLALDLHTSAAELADQLADRVLVDDLGRPAIDRSVARQLITEHQAAQQAAQQAAAARREADEAKRQRVAQLAPVINRPAERVRAIQARQEAMRAAGQLDPGDTLAAIGLAAEVAERDERRFDAKADLTADLMAGRSTGRRFQIRHDE